MWSDARQSNLIQLQIKDKMNESFAITMRNVKFVINYKKKLLNWQCDKIYCFWAYRKLRNHIFRFYEIKKLLSDFKISACFTYAFRHRGRNLVCVCVYLSVCVYTFLYLIYLLIALLRTSIQCRCSTYGLSFGWGEPNW